MSQILTQEEVDALLKGISDGESRQNLTRKKILQLLFGMI
jgi:flagellar motor switch protein FliM